MNFNTTGGLPSDFEKLFYPVRVDEGQYAFQKYSQQMSHVREGKIIGSHDLLNWELTRQIHATLHRYDPKLTQPPKPRERDVIVDNNTKDSEMDLVLQLKRLMSQKPARRPPTNQPLLASALDWQGNDIAPKDNTGQGGAELPSAPVDNGESMLMHEPDPGISHSALQISGGSSRVLALASAGHGKTTLLKRIALFFCKDNRISEGDMRIMHLYSLDSSLERIPCIIALRDIPDGNYAIHKAIVDSAYRVFHGEEVRRGNRDVDTAELRTAVEKWVNANRSAFFLLIDGLDELADNMRLNFLISLEDYLLGAPQAHVLLTSRVTGLSEPGVMEKLDDMRFRGRSILPLTDEQAQAYSKIWISEIHPDRAAQLNNTVNLILTAKKYAFLKEFMRTPLELLVILKQVSLNTVSLNRFQMFYDMLWELFTGHEKRYDRKRMLFEDVMTLLGFIAYQMQLSDSMYISCEDLEKQLEKLQGLSFQTERFRDKEMKTFLANLDSLAANVGIIEKDDQVTGAGYTFPIRAYQEFLVAYACCHLQLDEDYSMPRPTQIIAPHITDSRWLSVVNFALSDLKNNNPSEFDRLLELAFREMTDMEHLQAVVDSDLLVTRNHVMSLCERLFVNPKLTKEQRSLLLTCMRTQAAGAYAYALRILFQSGCQSGPCNYLEAYAIAAFMWELNTGKSPYADAMSRLTDKNSTKASVSLAAMMISLSAKAGLGESLLAGYREKAKEDLQITFELCDALYTKAKNYHCVQAVIALTDLWISSGTDLRTYLTDPKIIQILLDEIEQHQQIMIAQYSQKFVFDPDGNCKDLLELLIALGSLPDVRSLVYLIKAHPLIPDFLDAAYRESKTNPELDRIAILLCKLYFTDDADAFLEEWTVAVCKEAPVDSVRLDTRSRREQNHFGLIKHIIEPYAKSHRQRRIRTMNVLASETSISSLFYAGKYLEAAKLCIANMELAPITNRVNLAFLIRYGKLDPKDLDTDLPGDIPELLAPAIEQLNPFAYVNLFLYYLEKVDTEVKPEDIAKAQAEAEAKAKEKNESVRESAVQTNARAIAMERVEADPDFLQAKKLIHALQPDDWEKVALNLWWSEIWLPTSKGNRTGIADENRDVGGDPEAALVCFLASALGQCPFDDYNDIQVRARQCFRYPHLLIH